MREKEIDQQLKRVLLVNVIFFSSLSQEMYREHWGEMHVDIIV